jgi:hypothetical protein
MDLNLAINSKKKYLKKIKVIKDIILILKFD